MGLCTRAMASEEKGWCAEETGEEKTLFPKLRVIYSTAEGRNWIEKPETGTRGGSINIKKL